MTNFGVASMARTRRYHPLVGDDLTAAVAYYDEISVDPGIVFGLRFAIALKSSPIAPIRLARSMNSFEQRWLTDSRMSSSSTTTTIPFPSWASFTPRQIRVGGLSGPSDRTGTQQ